MQLRKLTLTMALLAATLSASAADDAFFPFGVFDKSDPYGRFDKLDYEPGSKQWKNYRNRFLEVLKRYNLNTMVNTQYRDDSHARFVLDQLHESGIKVIFQPGNPFNRKTDVAVPGYAGNSVYRHPAIIAYKLGNEPKNVEQLNGLKDRYQLIRKHYDKPIVTAMVGEIMAANPGSARLKVKHADDMSARSWKMLDPQILFARHYPIRRTYDLVDWPRDKMTMPFNEWCAYMETAYKDRPWWFIPQLAGKGKDKSRKSYWRLPTASEVNAMVHVALANGARGVIGWGIPAYDVVRKPSRVFAVDEKLRPEAARDGSVPMEQYGRIASLAAAHSGLLLRHRRAGFTVKGGNEEVITVPRIDPKTGKLYVYAVNLNTERSNKAVFDIPSSVKVSRAVDLYTNKSLIVKKAADGTRISGMLEPGEALFVNLN